MSELKNGTTVHLTNGSTATVKNLLGEGGQGYVYLASVNGKDMALKWYKKQPSSEVTKFYNNLQHNVDSGSPSPNFIWPEYVTTHEFGSFGYVMKLRPNGYYEFGKFLNGKYRFSSLMACITSAIEICKAFRALHAKGLSYQDINDGNFFIDPSTGHVCICDNDNVFPNGEKSGILGKARYMAPELVTGSEESPNAYTDKFSLALILFEIIYMNHPFEGQAVISHPCMTESIENQCFGSHIQFILDPKNNTNAPVRGLHNNVIKRWPAFPKLLRDTFIHEFSSEIIQNPKKRMTENQWLDVLTMVRDKFIVCPHCGRETIVDSPSSCACLECGKSIVVKNTMLFEKRTLILTDNNNLYLDNNSTPNLKVEHSPQDPASLFIRNMMNETIDVETPSGKIRNVSSGEYLPVKVGLKLKIKLANSIFVATIQ